MGDRVTDVSSKDVAGAGGTGDEELINIAELTEWTEDRSDDSTRRSGTKGTLPPEALPTCNVSYGAAAGGGGEGVADLSRSKPSR